VDTGNLDQLIDSTCRPADNMIQQIFAAMYFLNFCDTDNLQVFYRFTLCDMLLILHRLCSNYVQNNKNFFRNVFIGIQKFSKSYNL